MLLTCGQSQYTKHWSPRWHDELAEPFVKEDAARQGGIGGAAAEYSNGYTDLTRRDEDRARRMLTAPSAH